MNDLACCPWPQHCACGVAPPTPAPPAWRPPTPVFDLSRSSDTWELTRDVLLGEVARAGRRPGHTQGTSGLRRERS